MVLWCLNAFFLLGTYLYYYAPEGHHGALLLLRYCSLEFEKNLASYWEGWCFLAVALLAFERSERRQEQETSADEEGFHGHPLSVDD